MLPRRSSAVTADRRMSLSEGAVLEEAQNECMNGGGPHQQRMPVGNGNEVGHPGDPRSIDAHLSIAWTAEDVGEQRVEAARAGDDARLEGDGRKLSGHRVRGRAELDAGRTGDATIEGT